MELVSIETEAERSQIAAFLLKHRPNILGIIYKLQLACCSKALIKFFDDRLGFILGFLDVCSVQ